MESRKYLRHAIFKFLKWRFSLQKDSTNLFGNNRTGLTMEPYTPENPGDVKRPLRNNHDDKPYNLQVDGSLAVELLNALTSHCCPHYAGLPQRDCGGSDEENCEECWQDAINFMNGIPIPDRSTKIDWEENEKYVEEQLEERPDACQGKGYL